MSNLTRVVSAITTILFAIAAFIFLGTNIFVAKTSYEIMRDINDIENPKDPLKGKKLNIVNNRIGDTKQFKSGYEEMAEFHNIKASRFVNFNASVPLRTLLKKGERAPLKSTKSVFASTRAIYYAREECKRLLETIASQCQVERARGEMKNDMVSINVALRFVQKEPFGDIESGSSLSFETVSSQLAKPRLQTSITGAPGQRKSLYRKAATECTSIKQREGNCAITRINVYGSYNVRSRQVTLSGSAEYAFLASL